MQTTLDPTPEAVAQATGNVERAHTRLVHLLSFVPDDKLTWAPSPSSRSSLRLVAHCAASNAFFTKVIKNGLPQPMPTPEEFFRGLSEGEATVATREEALALLEGTTADLRRAIDALTAIELDATPDSPFGPLPMSFWLEQTGEHLAYHAGQLAYMQTIWGDLDNHLN